MELLGSIGFKQKRDSWGIVAKSGIPIWLQQITGSVCVEASLTYEIDIIEKLNFYSVAELIKAS